MDELESKFKSREIEVINEHHNVEIRTKNKLLMEHTKEHVEAIKGNKGDMCKNNSIKNHKGVLLT